MCAAATVGAAVSIAGGIGFVGLVVPLLHFPGWLGSQPDILNVGGSIELTGTLIDWQKGFA